MWITAGGQSWKGIRTLPDICENHLSDESLVFINSCLRKCIDSHALCQKRESGLPARLLHVGSRGDTTVRLVETDSSATSRYVALSYCWGNSVMVKTTEAYLEAMKLGVDTSQLPQAYVDAITMTQELGIQYLWVDALCIIQDSHEDWEKESAKMSGIYANAHLTIAASSSGSAKQPFLRGDPRTESHADLHDRQVFSKQVVDEGNCLKLKSRIISESGIHSRWQGGSEGVSPMEPWSQRGWTLQEQLLSTRLLLFSSGEMQWSCQEALWCECRSRLNHRRLFGQKPVSQISSAPDAFRFWHKVVENYSKRLLTEPKDKLAAISGIAATLQEKIWSRYAAGLWLENIDMDLLWRRAHPALPTNQPRWGISAPSFSWASIEAEVDYCCFRDGKQLYRRCASVLGVETNTRPKAPLGYADGGTLTAWGPLIPGSITTFSRHGVYVVRLGQLELRMVADIVLQPTTVTRPDGGIENGVCRWTSPRNGQDSPADGPEHPCIDGPPAINQLPATNFETSFPRSGVRCWALRLGSFSPGMNLGPRKWEDHEMLILGQPPRASGCFQRLGLITYRINEDQSPSIAELDKEGELATITLI